MTSIPAKLLFLSLLAQIRIILIHLTRERMSYSFILFLSPIKSNSYTVAENEMFWSVAVADNQQFANKESKVESSCSSLLVTHGIIGLARGKHLTKKHLRWLRVLYTLLQYLLKNLHLQQLIGHPWNNWTGKGRERGRLKTSQRTSCSDGIC